MVLWNLVVCSNSNSSSASLWINTLMLFCSQCIPCKLKHYLLSQLKRNLLILFGVTCGSSTSVPTEIHLFSVYSAGQLVHNCHSTSLKLLAVESTMCSLWDLHLAWGIFAEFACKILAHLLQEKRLY